MNTMDTAAQTHAPISEPLTWAQICARYPDEWVAFVEIGWLDDTTLEFTTARVVGHGATRRESFERARPFRGQYDEIANFYTGESAAPHPAWKWV